MSAAEDILKLIRSRRFRVTREIIEQRILGLADRYLPRFRNIIRAAIRMGQNVSLEQLEAALRMRSVDAVQQAIPWEGAEQAMGVTLPNAITDLAAASARTAERLLPGSLTATFDLTNPLSVVTARDHGAELVTQISEETQRAIRNIIARAIQEGHPPRTAAREIRGTIGLNERQEAAIAKMQEGGASDRTLTVARGRMIRERAEMIAHTETLWSANEGQRMLWRQMAESRLIEPGTAKQEWICTPDDKLCELCAPLDGKTWAIGTQIQTAIGLVDGPILHPRCRCTAALVVDS